MKRLILLRGEGHSEGSNMHWYKMILHNFFEFPFSFYPCTELGFVCLFLGFLCNSNALMFLSTKKDST